MSGASPKTPPSPGGRPRGRLWLCSRFYLGLGAPATWQSFPSCRVRAAGGYPPDLVLGLVSSYRGGTGEAARINFRCARVTPSGSSTAFFVKEFPRHHLLHDLERWVRCSRVDRAWRAGHLLPRVGVLTPRPVGTAQARGEGGTTVEYLVTEWLAEAVPLPDLLEGNPEVRASALSEFARELRRWHQCGIYLRDLVKNVLVSRAGGERQYWLTDLDGLHPFRRLSRRRVLHQMGQLSEWAGRLSADEVELICGGYFGERRGSLREATAQALLGARGPKASR